MLALHVIELLENFHPPSLKQKVRKCSFWRKWKANSLFNFLSDYSFIKNTEKTYFLICKRKSLPFLQVGWYQRTYKLASTQLWEHLLANQCPDVWLGYWQDTRQSWTDVPLPIANLWPKKTEDDLSPQLHGQIDKHYTSAPSSPSLPSLRWIVRHIAASILKVYSFHVHH